MSDSQLYPSVTVKTQHLSIKVSHAEAIIMDNSASHPSGFNEADKNIHTGTHGYAKIHTNSRTNANTQP